MMDIEVGDEIICIDNSSARSHLTVGKSYVVTEYLSWYNWLKVVDDLGNSTYWNNDKFDCLSIKRNRKISDILK